MYSSSLKKLRVSPTVSRNIRRNRPIRPITRAANDNSGINWKYTEAVNGRASMYGTIMGTLNWGLTGLNVIEQTHFFPFALLGCGTSLIALYTMTDAFRKLSEEEFDKFATINTGRVSMVLFSGLVAASIVGV